MTDPNDGIGYGWHSDLPTFVNASPAAIEKALTDFVRQVSGEQRMSWQRCIAWLQREYGYCIREQPAAYTYATILEYELPRDFRRPDILVLEGCGVVILEVKGGSRVSRAAIDQVAAYARDLRAYHAACEGRPVVPVVVPANAPATPRKVDDVWIVGPEGIHGFLHDRARELVGNPISPASFLQSDAYAPLPSIVQAARSLYFGRPLPRIKRARANTDPALQSISEIAKMAATRPSRHLVLLTGVPGSGKTLVGLQLVHAGWLDDLAIARNGRKMTPAVYLSGNGPLVAVLQDVLKGGAVPGSAFVQDIKKYVAYYSARRDRIPPEHLLVFDEAQRAHDAERVAQVHKKPLGESEPEHLLDICSRIPEWSVLVALIGEGQAIHAGEEGGVSLWRHAVDHRVDGSEWTVHLPDKLAATFEGSSAKLNILPSLNLDNDIRFHLTPRVHEYVDAMLGGTSDGRLSAFADELYAGGHRFLATQSLADAQAYLRERYSGAPESRFGVLASSKDKWLSEFGVDNTYQSTMRLKVGPWYNNPPEDPLSCCQLTTVATEFSAQGLELDGALVAWGSDLRWESGEWTNRHSRGTRSPLRDPLQMRRNVYRVLLTRGRDVTVVFVPSHPEMTETWLRLLRSGFRELDKFTG